MTPERSRHVYLYGALTVLLLMCTAGFLEVFARYIPSPEAKNIIHAVAVVSKHLAFYSSTVFVVVYGIIKGLRVDRISKVQIETEQAISEYIRKVIRAKLDGGGK